MAITINLTQPKRKKRKNGIIPVYIRLTEYGKSCYKSTSISVKATQWNAKKQEVNSKHGRQDHLSVELIRQN